MSTLKQKEPLFTEAIGLPASWSHPHHLTNSTSLSLVMEKCRYTPLLGANSTVALTITHWDHSRVTRTHTTCCHL